MDYLNHKNVPTFLKKFWRRGKISDEEFDKRAKASLRKRNIAATDEELSEAEQGEQTKQDSLVACFY